MFRWLHLNSMSALKIAFLGTGRMGTCLAEHIIAAGHQVVVWNRTPENAQGLVNKGAQLAESPEAAVSGVDLVISCLFGPAQVREVIIEPALIPDNVPWADATTVGPQEAREFAAAVGTYVATPVIGSLIPARNSNLGVYVGGTDAQAVALVADVVAPWAAAQPERLKVVDSAVRAATGKLLANLALAVTAQGVAEALLLAGSQGVSVPDALDMLSFTGLAFMKDMKQPFILGERDTRPGDFTAAALLKDSRLMVENSEAELPAVSAAIESLAALADPEQDFSAMLVAAAERAREL